MGGAATGETSCSCCSTAGFASRQEEVVMDGVAHAAAGCECHKLLQAMIDACELLAGRAF